MSTKTITVSNLLTLIENKEYKFTDELLDVWYCEIEGALLCSAQRIINFNNGLNITFIENEATLASEYDPAYGFLFDEDFLIRGYYFDINANFTLLNDVTGKPMYLGGLYDIPEGESLLEINYQYFDYDDFI